jgi:predicted O-linked N-acetylglucosamine transferase (SPINDLY family)
MTLHQQGQLAEAQQIYRQILDLQATHFDALHLSGVIAAQTGDFEAAVALFRKAVEADPCNAAAFAVHVNWGLSLGELDQWEAALASFARALAIRPDCAEAHFGSGQALGKLRQWNAALGCYNRAIGIKPNYGEAHLHRAKLLKQLRQLPAALDGYDRAIAAMPDCAEAYSNRGNIFKELKMWEAALENYDRAIAIQSDFAEAYSNRGNLLRDLKRYKAAVASYDVAISLNPDSLPLRALRLYARIHGCDWPNLQAELAQLIQELERRPAALNPFCIIALSDSGPLQRKVAEKWVEQEYTVNPAPPGVPKSARRDRLRIGYFSADFRDHAVSTLSAELFERHDRSRVELSAFSFGHDTRDPMRRRLERAFDRFMDVRNRSDLDVVLLAREMGLDIAVDLGGFTTDSRPRIFSMRAAPLQVSYLGYPGTMGAPYIDYLIADRTLVPDGERDNYSEKIIYLPHGHLVCDTTRAISGTEFSRKELGLPQSGFVFCCFNGAYKIMPETFDGWMRILNRVEDSVLWLKHDSPEATANLRREAVRRQVSADRLIFAQRMDSMPEHLARHRRADLFLDTLPYNAHTTAVDALWAGLPLLTRAGRGFAGRVSASVLNALQMPELITSSGAEYEDAAVALATDPLRLAEIRLKLARNRLTAPAFDTRRSARYVETAYQEIYERHLAGLPPEHIHVDAD